MHCAVFSFEFDFVGRRRITEQMTKARWQVNQVEWPLTVANCASSDRQGPEPVPCATNQQRQAGGDRIGAQARAEGKSINIGEVHVQGQQMKPLRLASRAKVRVSWDVRTTTVWRLACRS